MKDALDVSISWIRNDSESELIIPGVCFLVTARRLKFVFVNNQNISQCASRIGTLGDHCAESSWRFRLDCEVK